MEGTTKVQFKLLSRDNLFSAVVPYTGVMYNVNDTTNPNAEEKVVYRLTAEDGSNATLDVSAEQLRNKYHIIEAVVSGFKTTPGKRIQEVINELGDLRHQIIASAVQGRAVDGDPEEIGSCAIAIADYVCTEIINQYT